MAIGITDDQLIADKIILKAMTDIRLNAKDTWHYISNMPVRGYLTVGNVFNFNQFEARYDVYNQFVDESCWTILVDLFNSNLFNFSHVLKISKKLDKTQRITFFSYVKKNNKRIPVNNGLAQVIQKFNNRKHNLTKINMLKKRQVIIAEKINKLQKELDF
tara:strand:- start:177 stop:656 length:480 start_codon:yes stop_codon:yes gene_type:complete